MGAGPSRFYDALNRRDLDALLAVMDPEVESAARCHVPLPSGIKARHLAILFHLDEAGFAIRFGASLAERVASTAGMPELRVGMNTGSAVDRAGDWYGAAVNLAARVTAAASGGDVLLTEHTRVAGGELDDVTLEALGTQSLRNVAERIALYRVVARREMPPRELDPVCRMRVEPQRCAGTLTWEGRTFHFCSVECIAAFSAAPDRYAAEGAA